jgi:rubrerythrin
MKKIDFKKSKTYKNLITAFEGEAAARVRYDFFSSQAKKDGYVHISDVFKESSDNEREHAEIWFKLIHDGSVPPTQACLEEAIKNEHYE